jgi:signal transduction histidine kinase
MAARLDRILTRQRAFVADAGHELRTPLTALRLRLENLEDTIEPGREGDLEAALARTERLGEVVEHLLVTARSEERVIVPVPVDLIGVLAERRDYRVRPGGGRGGGVGAPGCRGADRRQPPVGRREPPGEVRVEPGPGLWSVNVIEAGPGM